MRKCNILKSVTFEKVLRLKKYDISVNLVQSDNMKLIYQRRHDRKCVPISFGTKQVI